MQVCIGGHRLGLECVPNPAHPPDLDGVSQGGHDAAPWPARPASPNRCAGARLLGGGQLDWLETLEGVQFDLGFGTMLRAHHQGRWSWRGRAGRRRVTGSQGAGQADDRRAAGRDLPDCTAGRTPGLGAPSRLGTASGTPSCLLRCRTSAARATSAAHTRSCPAGCPPAAVGQLPPAQQQASSDDQPQTPAACPRRGLTNPGHSACQPQGTVAPRLLAGLSERAGICQPGGGRPADVPLATA